MFAFANNKRVCTHKAMTKQELTETLKTECIMSEIVQRIINQDSLSLFACFLHSPKTAELLNSLRATKGMLRHTYHKGFFPIYV